MKTNSDAIKCWAQYVDKSTVVLLFKSPQSARKFCEWLKKEKQ